MERLRDRFRGALLGTMLGDAVGAPWEGASPDRIASLQSTYQSATPDEQQEMRSVFGLLLSDETRRARYTDDTQMTLVLAETLITHGHFARSPGDTRFESALAARFADRYDATRLYGPGGDCVLQELRRGIAWDEPAQLLFSGTGSYGNGAAMRVAPLGLFFHEASGKTLRNAARRSALPTHTHPLGIAGAVMQAAAVSSVCRQPLDTFAPLVVLEDVQTILGKEDSVLPYQEACHKIRQLLPQKPSPKAVAEELGNDIAALDSVPTALYTFLAHPSDFRTAVTFAVHTGGDTDTIAAMVGALSGAYLGGSRLPVPWLAGVENGLHGRDYAQDLADRLFDVWQQGKRNESP